ncbi:hypothetical protein pb186bvf_020093 [Paramecium bursaria]
MLNETKDELRNKKKVLQYSFSLKGIGHLKKNRKQEIRHPNILSVFFDQYMNALIIIGCFIQLGQLFNGPESQTIENLRFFYFAFSADRLVFKKLIKQYPQFFDFLFSLIKNHLYITQSHKLWLHIMIFSQPSLIVTSFLQIRILKIDAFDQQKFTVMKNSYSKYCMHFYAQK